MSTLPPRIDSTQAAAADISLFGVGPWPNFPSWIDFPIAYCIQMGNTGSSKHIAHLVQNNIFKEIYFQQWVIQKNIQHKI